MALRREERPVGSGTPASPLFLSHPLPTYPASPPHGILEKLRQDVVQWHRDEGETGSHMSIDADAGSIAILVLTQASVDRSQGSNLGQGFSDGGDSAPATPRDILQFLETFFRATARSCIK